MAPRSVKDIDARLAAHFQSRAEQSRDRSPEYQHRDGVAIGRAREDKEFHVGRDELLTRLKVGLR